VDSLRNYYDPEWGGFQKTPKFIMPAIWNYLISIAHQYGSKIAKEMVFQTLQKIANGGIYDHIGGGFARYSVDESWHIPHFEKMLYDNGQLLSLYARAHALIPEANFEKTILQTISWLENEMLSDSGGYFSALDADSEGEEGKYYTWTYEEFLSIAGKNSEVLMDYYNVTEAGNWEEGKNNLRLLASVKIVSERHQLHPSELQKLIILFETKANQYRKQRVRPRLDDKILAAWNGLTIRGLVDSFKAIGLPSIADKALRTGEFIIQNLVIDGKLFRNFKNGVASINGYLEDYVWTIDSLIGLYEISLDFKWLKKANELTDYVLRHFYNKENEFFYFTNDTSDRLIARKQEIFDNVIPSSNAGMARNLLILSHYFGSEVFLKIANNMLNAMSNKIRSEPEYVSYWGDTMLLSSIPETEVVIAGSIDTSALLNLLRLHVKNLIVISTSGESGKYIPLVRGKNQLGTDTTFYVCYNKTCQLPVTDINSAIDQIKRINS